MSDEHRKSLKEVACPRCGGTGRVALQSPSQDTVQPSWSREHGTAECGVCGGRGFMLVASDGQPLHTQEVAPSPAVMFAPADAAVPMLASERQQALMRRKFCLEAAIAACGRDGVRGSGGGIMLGGRIFGVEEDGDDSIDPGRIVPLAREMYRFLEGD